jgi:hypothetical protein
MEHFEEMRTKALEYAKRYHNEVYQEFLKSKGQKLKAKKC